MIRHTTRCHSGYNAAPHLSPLHSQSHNCGICKVESNKLGNIPTIFNNNHFSNRSKGLKNEIVSSKESNLDNMTTTSIKHNLVKSETVPTKLNHLQNSRIKKGKFANVAQVHGSGDIRKSYVSGKCSSFNKIGKNVEIVDGILHTFDEDKNITGVTGKLNI